LKVHGHAITGSRTPVGGMPMGALPPKILGNEVDVCIIECRFRPAGTETLQTPHGEFGKNLKAGCVDQIAAIGPASGAASMWLTGRAVLATQGLVIGGLNDILDNLAANLITEPLPNDRFRNLAWPVSLDIRRPAH
jgi:hypothetical protein